MTATLTKPSSTEHPLVDSPVRVTRRRLDSTLIAFGALASLVFAVAGSLLMWGQNFSSDYVRKELASQNISFPPKESLIEDGRTDLAKFGGERVDTGSEAEAYASYIDGHLTNIGGGKTYADLGADERAAAAAVKEATTAGKPAADVAQLQATADGITATRNTLFKGETLRGLLLSAYAWSTVGRIAGIAAWGAFAAAVLMAILVVFGLRHRSKITPAM